MRGRDKAAVHVRGSTCRLAVAAPPLSLRGDFYKLVQKLLSRFLCIEIPTIVVRIMLYVKIP